MKIMSEMKDRSPKDCQCRKMAPYVLPLIGVVIGVGLITAISIIQVKKTFKSLNLDGVGEGV